MLYTHRSHFLIAIFITHHIWLNFVCHVQVYRINNTFISYSAIVLRHKDRIQHLGGTTSIRLKYSQVDPIQYNKENDQNQVASQSNIIFQTKQGLIKLLRIPYRFNGLPCWSQVALKKLKGEPSITLRNESMFNNTRVITINDINVFIKMM